MTIRCKHVHRLVLQKFLNFCAAHLPVRLDIDEIPVFLIFDMVVKMDMFTPYGHIIKLK